MKRVLSVLLAVCIIFSLSIGVFAATMNASADKKEIKAGEDVTVSVTPEDAFENYTTFTYFLHYDDSLFELKQDANNRDVVTSAAGITVSAKFKDSKGSYYKISSMSTTGEGLTFEAGKCLATLTFTAKSDIKTTADAKFELVFEEGSLADFTDTEDTAGPAVTVTVTPASTPAESSYTISASGTASINVNATTDVTFTVANTDTNNAYNSYDIQATYNSSVLDYVSINQKDATVTADNGTLRIIGYGESKSTPIVLTFKGKTAGTSDVTITSAKIDEEKNADLKDAPEATILTPTATITVSAIYSVTLDKTIFTGADSVTGGTDYTFSANDTEHYAYSNVTATMGGETVTVIDNSDGTYTIKDVTGDLVISGTRTGKQYSVTVTGNEASKVTAAATANYGTDFTFTFSGNDASKIYTITVTVGGTEVTPTVNGTSYTIAGTAITGNIVINAASTVKPVETVNVKFEGNAIADANGEATAKKSTPYTFTVTKAEGYTYTVTAKNADGDITLTETNGVYTIPADKVTSDITITVNKTAVRTVEVFDYVKANNTQFWLVTVKSAVSEGSVLTYNGSQMFWSDKYQAYAYLVIDTTGKSAATVKTEAAAAIGETAGKAVSIDYSGDVNATGNVDVNDAQLVYNMYNVKYTSFANCTMEKFLRADMNFDKSLTVADAAAIVSIILSK